MGEIVKELFPQPPAFVWASDRCTQVYDPELGECFWVKNLKKIKQKAYPLESVIMVDDSPEKHGRNYGNLVRVRPFVGDMADNELPLLLPYLERLREVENIRTIEKRQWRVEVASQEP